MRIIFFTESYKPYISGVTTVLENLANYLTLKGHQVWIVAPWYPEEKKVLSKIIRLPSFPSKTYPGFRIAIPFFTRLFQKIKLIVPEIIHSHSPYTLGILAKIYSRRLKVPFVYTFHTIFTDYLHYFPILPPKLAEYFLKRYFGWFLKNTPVVVPTEFVKNMIAEFAPSMIEIIPSGIDLKKVLEADSFDLRKKIGLSPDTKILLYVGRLSQEKNISFLMASLNVLAKKRSDWHLLLVASGPEENNLKNFSRELGLRKQLTFWPQVPHSEIYSLYRSADIFVCSSKSEAQGMVLIEAMAAGLPVVAVAAKGVSDIINKNVGFLVGEDIFEFSQAIEKLLESSDLRKTFGEGARHYVGERYSASITAEKMEKLYFKLTRVR